MRCFCSGDHSPAGGGAHERPSDAGSPAPPATRGRRSAAPNYSWRRHRGSLRHLRRFSPRLSINPDRPVSQIGGPHRAYRRRRREKSLYDCTSYLGLRWSFFEISREQIIWTPGRLRALCEGLQQDYCDIIYSKPSSSQLRILVGGSIKLSHIRRPRTLLAEP